MATGLLNTNSVLRGFTQTLVMRSRAATPFYPKIATVINSTGYDEKYGWVADFPAMREWLGERQFKELLMADYTLPNKLYESSLLIERTVWEDNRLGTTTPALNRLAAEATYQPDKLMFAAMVAGESTTGFDGQFFFDTDHSFGDSGTQSNDLTYAAATGTTPTAAEFRAAYNQAYAAMLAFKGDNGEPFFRPTQAENVQGPLVLVPPSLYPIAADGLNQLYDSVGNRVTVLGQPQLISIAYLTDATKFYVINPNDEMKPFVIQIREPLRFATKGLTDGDIEFKHAKVMTEWRGAVGYLAWWNSVLTTFT
jgi:phage major head subunit gpT-like protein